MSEAISFMKGIIRRFAGNEYVLMVCMAAVVGVLGGYGAVGFRWLIGFFQGLFFSQQGSGGILDAVNSLLVCQADPPIIGGAIVGPMVYFFAREARGHGVPEVMEAVA